MKMHCHATRMAVHECLLAVVDSHRRWAGRLIAAATAAAATTAAVTTATATTTAAAIATASTATTATAILPSDELRSP